jgi:hypothetical protein
MAKIQTDRMGQDIKDFRVKAPVDIIDWTVKNFGYDKNTGQERTMNATVVHALRTLREIKS